MGNRTLKDAIQSWMAVGSRFRAKPSALTQLKGRRSAIKAATIALCVLLTWTAVATTYVYDAQGRLVAVTDDQGASARYVYDKSGNLTKVDRLVAGDLVIFGFSPSRGGAGVVVKISGYGFDPVPAQNVVKFNGADAVVSNASTTELTAIVPIGATTGPISVTVGANTASSSVNFSVVENAKAPVILNVNPLVVSAGGSVTASGQNFSPVLNQTDVRLNRRPVVPSALASAQVVFPVSSDVGSGKVSLDTPFGQAVSAQDVLVVPTGVAIGDIAQVRRLALDSAPEGMSTTATGQYVAVLFDAASEDYLSAQFSSISVTNISYSLYSTSNALLADGTVSSTSPTALLPKLPATGTYLLLLKPTSGPATWNLAIEKAKVLTQEATSPPFSTSVAGQRKRFTLTAKGGGNMGLGVSDLVITAGTGSYVNVTVYKPDGYSLTGANCSTGNNGCDLNLSNMPGGKYSVVVEPGSSSQIVSFKMTLSTDLVRPLARVGDTTLNLPLHGQNGRLTLAGVTGETLTLRLQEVMTTPVARMVSYIVYKPDGTLLEAFTTAASATTLLLSHLPVTGNYTVFVSPSSSETFSAKFSLVEAMTGNLVINGASSSFSPLVDQSVSIAFTASGGENLGLGITGLTVSGGVTDSVVVKIYKQDGTTVISTSCYVNKAGCSLYAENVVAGTYRIVVASPADRQVSFTATLSTDAVHVLTANTTTGLNLRHGQRGRLTFYGAQSETFAFRAANQATVPASVTYYKVHKPNNAFLVSMAPSISGTLNLSNLADSGDYKVMVEPDNGATLSAQITLAAQMVGQLTSGASGASFSPIPGQNVYLSFTASAGNYLGLGISNLVLSESNYVDVAAYKPDGSSLFTTRCNLIRNGCGLDFPNLSAGTYRVVLQPANSNQAMSFNATLSADVTGALPRDTASPLNLTWGQNGRLTFSATAGEALVLLAGGTSSPAYQDVEYSVLKPDGTRLTWNTSAWATQLNMASLPVTGTYTVLVNPLYGASFTAQLTLDTTP